MILYSMTIRITSRNRSEIRLIYRKLLLTLCSLLVICQLSASDDLPIDRTSRLIQQSGQDTALVGKLIELADEYGRAKSDSAILCLEEALRLSRELGHIGGELSTLIELTITCKNAREYDKAHQFGKEGLVLCEGVSQPGKKARFLNTLGTVFSRTNLPDSAVMYYYKSLNLSLEQENWLMASKVYNSLGIFFTSEAQVNLPEAKKNFLKSYELTQALNDSAAFTRIQLNLGGVYGKMEEYDSASYFLELVAETCRRQNDKRLLSQVLNNIAGNKQKQERYADAMRLYQEVLVIESENKNQDQIVVVLQNIGFMCEKQGKLSEALPYLSRGLALAKKENLETRMEALHDVFANVYEGLGQFDSAISHLRKLQELKEKIYDESKTRAVEDANVKYETAEQEKQLILIREQREASRNERNTFILVSIFLALLLGLGFVAFYTKQQANRRLSAQKDVIERKEQEKTLLLRELHHRVKNNLQLISSLLNLQAYQLKDEAAASAVKEGQARVEAMAMIHRQLYLKEEETKISLPDYLEHMMQNLLYAFGTESGKVEVDKQVDNLEIDADLAIPLGLIINELLTNSLKYAFKNVPNPRLNVKAERLPQELLVNVSDNGPGVTGETKRKTSFGMEMVKSLARQMKAELEINQENGHSVSLRIPFDNRVQLS